MESDRPAISVCSLPPCGAGQSHVEILDSNRACESAAGFQSCAHDPISIPMLRPFAENWPHAIALPQGGGERTEYTAPFCINTNKRALLLLLRRARRRARRAGEAGDAA